MDPTTERGKLRERTRDYRNDATRNPRFRKIKRAVWKRWRQLAEDKEFLWETARLKFNLSLELGRNPETIRKLFSPRFQPSPLHPDRVAKDLRGIADPKLRALLQRYVRYTSRFQVSMRITQQEPYFRVEDVAGDPNKKFHVKVKRNHLEPAQPYHWDEVNPVSEFFASPALETAPELERALEQGYFRYVRIDDDQKGSLFRELVNFAYRTDAITFVTINAQQPYLLCLVGEDVPVETVWHRAGRVVAEFQKREFNRTHAGRPSKPRKLHARLNLILRSRVSKELAISLFSRPNPGSTEVPAKALNVIFSSLSQRKRKLKIPR